jgi:hypothetical protein
VAGNGRTGIVVPGEDEGSSDDDASEGLLADVTASRAALREMHLVNASAAIRRLTELHAGDVRAWLVAAQFHRAFSSVQYLETLMLYRASQVAVALDAKFYLFQRGQQKREEAEDRKNEGGGMV